MKEYFYDVAVIGAGPAGLAAASGAKKAGASRVVIIERDHIPGGILPQCIHNGFGLHNLKKDLTGPEYAEEFLEEAENLGVEIILKTMVLEIIPAAPGSATADNGKYLHRVIGVNRKEGMAAYNAVSVVLAMGCRERTRGNIVLPGTRPSGIFTAGTAQRFTNIEGYLPGRNIVILGSGDIGMIMARRLTFEGASVKAVVEVMPFIGGLSRNKAQCLDDFNIPVFLNHTVTYIKGNKRVEGVEIAEIDSEKNIIDGTRRFMECDTLLLSVGLIPENELTEKAGIIIDGKTRGPEVDNSFQTAEKGIFACGNVMHVSDLVDYVSIDSSEAGRAAAMYASGTLEWNSEKIYQIVPGDNVLYTVPQKADLDLKGFEDFNISLRVIRPLKNVRIIMKQGQDTVYESRILKMARPGEMERIAVTRSIRDSIKAVRSDRTITVEVRET